MLITGGVVIVTAPDTSPAVSNGVSGAQDRVPLHLSPVAAYWQEKYGITADDIRQVTDRLERQGVPERMRQDPGSVFPLLPRRNIHAVNVGAITLPERAPAHQPIPFRLTGALPDPSHTFTHFNVTRTDDVITIQPLGTRSGEPAPGIEVPIELDGEIDPLPPGRYRIEFPGQTTDEPRFITIE